jgi:hypothetical protein
VGGSMSSVVISGDTSGSITVSAPAVAGTNTATLPAATGTVMVSGNMPAFSAYGTAGQSIANGVWTKIAYNTKLFDTNTNYDNATNYRFTPTVSGYYQINANLFTSSSAAGLAFIAIYKNSKKLSGTVYNKKLSFNIEIICNDVSFVTKFSDFYLNKKTLKKKDIDKVNQYLFELSGRMQKYIRYCE